MSSFAKTGNFLALIIIFQSSGLKNKIMDDWTLQIRLRIESAYFLMSLKNHSSHHNTQACLQ